MRCLAVPQAQANCLFILGQNILVWRANIVPSCLLFEFVMSLCCDLTANLNLENILVKLIFYVSCLHTEWYLNHDKYQPIFSNQEFFFVFGPRRTSVCK